MRLGAAGYAPWKLSFGRSSVKKRYRFIAALLAVVLLAGGVIYLVRGGFRKKYSHAELAAMPAEQLLGLFLDNGLKVEDEVFSMYTRAGFAKLFKNHFDVICCSPAGLVVSAFDHLSLSASAREVYEKLTYPDKRSAMYYEYKADCEAGFVLPS